MRREPIFVALGVFFCLGALVPTLACRRERVGLTCSQLPAAPTNHVNDLVGLVPIEARAQLDRQLADFEAETGAPIIIHIAPELPEDTILEDYTLACANCWAASRHMPRNVIIFLFRRQRRVRIEVSRALERQLSNEYCQQVNKEMVPYFRKDAFDEGLKAGTMALMRALRE